MRARASYPGEWGQRDLGSMCQIQIGGTPSRDVLRYWAAPSDPDGFLWVSIGDLTTPWIENTKERISAAGARNSNVKVVRRGTTLMSFKLSIGKMARAGADLFTNEAIAAFEPLDEELDPNYLFHALPGSLGDLVVDQAIKGATLNKKKLAKLSIPLPGGVEQARIAEVLDTLDQAIAGAEVVVKKQQQLQLGLLLSLVAPQVPPGHWTTTTLGEAADWVSGGTPSKSYRHYWGGEVPWVSPKDMKVFLLGDTQDHLTTLGSHHGTRLVPRHSVLVVVRGMILAHTFPVCLTQREMAINQDVKAVLARPGVSGQFLGYWFRAHAERLLRLVTEATHGTKKIDLGDLKKFPIHLPPRAEQDRIATLLSTADDAIQGEISLMGRLQALKSGLSGDLLTGRIRTLTS